MGKLNFKENLFLGLAELNRFQNFLDDKGFKRHSILNTATFGIIEEIKFPEFTEIKKQDSFYVRKSGTPFNELTIQKGVAMDLNGNLIINRNEQQIAIPQDSFWYWIKISYEERVEETGTVSLDQFGNLTGIGTEFTKLLRGQPNYPTKVKFTNTLNGNDAEYEVVKVISDTSALISGDFNSENNMKFQVTGTFTPGALVSNSDKRIYTYDSVKVQLLPEVAFNQEPAKIQSEEFYLARVRNNGVDITLQDKRKEFWRSKSLDYLKNINRIEENPLLGVESVKYDVNGSPRNENWINLAFGFRSESYTVDTAAKKISILIGQGGKYKDTSFFVSGDFNGWRVYTDNGDWREVIDSQKTGTQIVITLDVLNPNDYLSSSTFQGSDSLTPERSSIMIAPPFEEIEFKVIRDGKIKDVDDVDLDTITNEPFPYPLIERYFSFPINTKVAKFKVPAIDDTTNESNTFSADNNIAKYKFNITYRYKIFNEYTEWKVFPNDSVGYYDENSFDNYGNLVSEPTDRTLKPYDGSDSDGFVEVSENPFSYQNFLNTVITGDVFGVNTTELKNAEPVVELFVGTSKRYQHFKGSLNLESNIFIHLNKKKLDGVTNLREGNTFILHIEQFITMNTSDIFIVQDYVNPTQFEIISKITLNDVAYIKNNVSRIEGASNRNRGLFITCTFNELGSWICHFESDITPKGTVRMIGTYPGFGNFNSQGEGINQGFWGWKALPDMDGRVAMGTSAVLAGGIGGVNSITLTSSNLPPHRHTVYGKRASRNTSGSGFDINQVYTGEQYSGQESYTSYTGGNNQAGGEAFPINFTPKHKKFFFIEKLV